jgi:hypothetical protein
VVREINHTEWLYTVSCVLSAANAKHNFGVYFPLTLSVPGFSLNSNCMRLGREFLTGYDEKEKNVR